MADHYGSAELIVGKFMKSIRRKNYRFDEMVSQTFGDDGEYGERCGREKIGEIADETD